MRSVRLCLLALNLLLVPSYSAADAAPAEAEHGLDEVIVTGERPSLDALRRQIDELERRFYARYNELNTNNDFDVNCRWEARTGTQLETLSCQAVYEEQALHDEGSAALEIFQRLHEYHGGMRDLVMPSSPPTPAIVAIEARRPEFQKNMQEVVRNSSKLVQILRDRAAAIDRYESERHRIFKLKPGQTTTSGNSTK